VAKLASDWFFLYRRCLIALNNKRFGLVVCAMLLGGRRFFSAVIVLFAIYYVFWLSVDWAPR